MGGIFLAFLHSRFSRSCYSLNKYLVSSGTELKLVGQIRPGQELGCGRHFSEVEEGQQKQN